MTRADFTTSIPADALARTLVVVSVLGASVLGASALGACASARTGPTDQVSLTPNTVRVETPSGTMEARTVAEDRAEAHTLHVPLDQAWAKLPAVYGDLSLPVTAFVDASHQIAARGTRVRGHLGKLRMSQLVTCGTDITGEEKANAYEVTLNVATVVSPAPNGETTILTMVTADARPMATSGDPVRCVTTGSLERRIATTLTLRAAVPK